MATTVSQYVRHLGFFKSFLFSKTAASSLEICRKHDFTASKRNLVKTTVRNKKSEQILSKSYSFLVQTLICIIIF